MMSKWLAIVLGVVLGFTPLAGVLAAGKVTGDRTVTVNMQTNKGTIVLELYPDKAPETVANFVEYARSGFYDGTIFHRVIPGFMIQGGGFEPDMKQKKTRAPIKNEADNGLSNLTGTIAMARTPDPNSATSQFFINVKDNKFLDYTAPTPQGWGYCVFGKVTEGMDVVHAIEQVPTTTKAGHQDVPVDPVVIEKVTVDEGK
jgi:peptidyl-prolyl cis-trans isomerase B (cyclophilin B)